ncbi:MAG: glycosyl hydrolase, partial [Bacteroidota bacterium]|nr:glycosyl hydrolase [Bacteroidota bacterium]
MNKLIKLLSLLFIFFVLKIDAQSINQNTDKKLKSLEYRIIGPFRGGRSCAVAGLPTKNNVYYFGGTGGGVWKTEDSGVHWNNVSDGYFGGSIGAVSVSESDPGIVYVGTGEETVRGNVSSGNGVWKSEDAGKTWQHIGLAKTRHISRIRIHPKNPDIVLIAAMGNLYIPNPERGIYKSWDGGKTWKNVLFVNDSVGAIDLCFDPTNPKVIYANTWRVQRNSYSLSSGGPGSSIWKSINGGDTWKEIKKNKGLPEGIWGISTISVCPSKPDRLYAMIENEHGGLYRSDDAGETWEKVNDNRELRQRAWYFSRVQTDPADPNTVYVLNVSLHKSTDGGKTFKTMPNGHGDHH